MYQNTCQLYLENVQNVIAVVIKISIITEFQNLYKTWKYRGQTKVTRTKVDPTYAKIEAPRGQTKVTLTWVGPTTTKIEAPRKGPVISEVKQRSWLP